LFPPARDLVDLIYYEKPEDGEPLSKFFVGLTFIVGWKFASLSYYPTDVGCVGKLLTLCLKDYCRATSFTGGEGSSSKA